MPRRRGRHRLHFAFRPDAAASDAAMKILSDLRRLGMAGTAIKRENLHVSLFPLWEGEQVPPDLIEVAVGLVQAIDGKPFEFKFDTLMSSWHGHDGHCAALASTHDPFELYNLQRKFVSRFEGMVRAGSLTPHMALLYADGLVERQAVEPVRWQAREFLLIRSFAGQARQDILGRWPLR